MQILSALKIVIQGGRAKWARYRPRYRWGNNTARCPILSKFHLRQSWGRLGNTYPRVSELRQAEGRSHPELYPTCNECLRVSDFPGVYALW